MFQQFYNLILVITLLKIIYSNKIIVNSCNKKISDHDRKYVYVWWEIVYNRGWGNYQMYYNKKRTLKL